MQKQALSFTPFPRLRRLRGEGGVRGIGYYVFAYVALVATLIAFASSANAQPRAELKSITIVVGSTPGGGYDTYARMLARHLGRHLPSQPGIVVQNMPGAS